MNKFMIYGGAAFVVILIIVVLYFVFTEVKNRKETSNIELPDINEIEQKERLLKMEENREQYGFGEELEVDESSLSDLQVNVDGTNFIKTHGETSVLDDFGGLLSSDGKLTKPTPKIGNKIDLPNIPVEAAEVTEEKVGEVDKVDEVVPVLETEDDFELPSL